MTYPSSKEDFFPFKRRGGFVGVGEPVNTDIYTQVSPKLNPGERTCVILAYGQSNITNYCDGNYTVTNTKSHMLDPITGAMFQTKEPMVGCNGGLYGFPGAITGNCLSRLGDLLIASGRYDRVILCNVGAGGTSSSQWAAGGDCNPRLVTAIRRLKSLGLTVNFVLRHQGESDTTQNIPYSTVISNIRSEVSTIRAEGVNASVIVCGVGYAGPTTYNTASYFNVRAAQLAACSAELGIYYGPDTDNFREGYRQSDNLHWNAAGATAVCGAISSFILASVSSIPGPIISVTRDPNTYVIQGGPTTNNNTWHNFASANPSLVRFKGKVFMYSRGISPQFNANNSSTGVYSCDESAFDGVTWNVHADINPVILSGPTGQTDDNGTYDPTAIVHPDGNSVLLYCQSFGPAASPVGGITVHQSFDGLHFTKLGHTGFYAGTPAAVVGPDNKIWVLAAFGNTDYSTKEGYRMLARSSYDGLNFQPEILGEFVTSSTPGTLDYQSAITARIIKEGSVYYMFYGAGSAQRDYPEGFMVARSTDLVNWEKNINPVMLRGPAGAFDGGAVWSPAVIIDRGTLYLFYECAGNTDYAGGTYEAGVIRDYEYAHPPGTNTYVTIWGHTCIARMSFNTLLANAAWVSTDSYTPKLIRASHSGKFICPAGLSSGSAVTQYSQGAWPVTPTWYVDRVKGWYRFSATGAGGAGAQCLTVPGNSRTLNTAMALYPWIENQGQEWFLADQSNYGWRGYGGPHKFINRYSGMAMEVPGFSLNDGVNLTQNNHSEAAHQRFTILDA